MDGSLPSESSPSFSTYRLTTMADTPDNGVEGQEPLVVAAAGPVARGRGKQLTNKERELILQAILCKMVLLHMAFLLK